MVFTINTDIIEKKKLSFVCDENEYDGVKRVAGYVCDDFNNVFGAKPDISMSKSGKNIVFGSMGKSLLIDECIKNAGIDVSAIKDKYECYVITADSDNMYVIGSDKRGTIYGLFYLSECLGVSPFTNWFDIKPARRTSFDFTESMMKTSKEPSVRYRGFFINDEWPAFGNWVNKHFGGFTVQAYEKIFEILLRMKGNYLWPAMWSSIFSNDGPGLANAELADEMGVVMGLSHHEPCLRHGEEYRYLRGKDSIYGDAWNFITNREGITRFWIDGLKRSGKFENVVTVGMRGEADSTILGKESTLKDNIDLLRDVLQTQNKLIREYVNEDIDKVPRMLALYKEVEPFFYGDENTEGLMGSPELEGVTLMLCDDNHGNLRTLPTDEMKGHKGGYGMYYHFDYHGGPVSFEWVNSSSLYKTWEQMTTAYEAGIKELWIVNVGDVFSNEYPLSFFLDLAYDYDKWGITNLNSAKEYTKLFVQRQFNANVSDEFKKEAAALLEGYTKIAHSRRPEAVNASVYAPMSYGERVKLKDNCQKLIDKAEKLMKECPEDVRLPYYELIYYPVLANMNVQLMWLDTIYNHYLAEISASMAMVVADIVKKRIEADVKIVDELHGVADGKWYGMGLSEHIGFKFWNEEECQYPVLHTFKPSNKARIVGVIPETGDHSEGGVWTKHTLVLPDFIRYDREEAAIELYATSLMDASFEVTEVSEGFSVSPMKGTVKGSNMLSLTVKKSAECSKAGKIHIHGEYMELDIEVPVAISPDKTLDRNTFVFDDSYVAIEAGHYAENTDGAGKFVELPGFGKMVSGMKAFPVEKTYIPGEDAPVLTYKVFTKDAGKYNVTLYIGPSNPPYKDYKLNYGIACNADDIKIINAIPEDFGIYDGNASWEYGPLNNIRLTSTEFELKEGINEIKVYAGSPGFVLEKLVVNKADKPVDYSYYGPVETRFYQG